MVKDKQRIVVDVSDLVNWHGNLSGIQRVVAEMAYRYERSGAVFCYYLEDTRTFHPLESFSELMAARHAPATAVEHDMRNIVTLQYKVYLKRAAKLLTPPIAVKIYKKAKRVIKSKSDNSITEPSRPSFVFRQNDTLLIFGAHWDKPHYLYNLRTIKDNVSIKIGHLIHDLIPISDPAHVAEVEHTRFPLYIKEISKMADIIFLTSQATERDYDNFLISNNIPQPHIERITLGENYTSHKADKPRGVRADESYILMVGTIEVRKNHALLYSVYKRAAELYIDLPKLIVVGRQGWLSGDIYYQMVHDSTISHKIHFMHSTTDQELSWLYKHCLFTVFSAFYEGWGLPVAEAAHYGKVTAASNTSSIPEVVGDGAVYFSPYSADDCLEVIQKLLDEKVRHRYEKILQKRPKVSWDDTYEQSLSAVLK